MIIVYGRVPPPLGGVSVFCKRRLEELKELNLDFEHIDSGKISSLAMLICRSLYFIKIKKLNLLIEVNVGNVWVLTILSMFGLCSHTKFIDHNSSRHVSCSGWKRRLFLSFSRKVSSISVVNEALKVNYPLELRSDILVESPFIAPSKHELEQATLEFPPCGRHLIEVDRRCVVLASAWKPVLTEYGEDLYGIIATLDLYERVSPLKPSFEFVLMIGRLGNSRFDQQIIEKIKRMNKELRNFTFLEGDIVQLPLLEKTAVLLRLTTTDGDSISVREALHFGAKVIATNVTPRPDGCNLVKLGESGLIETHLLSLLDEASCS